MFPVIAELSIDRMRRDGEILLKEDYSFKEKDHLAVVFSKFLSHSRHRDQSAANVDVHNLQPWNLLIDLFGDQFIEP